ncbi:MAG: hypothetical protein M1500_01575 [Candidatus Marsarchaeota archaeon]|nr:hypothetical protein [Candidatus Marsarchaeota archaeon]MCL5112389.1 hypothetical protein [Candidatus Marsarchaeota archaeon]
MREEQDTGLSDIKSMLRQTDPEMYSLVNRVIGGDSGAKHVVEDVIYSLNRDEAYDVLEKLEEEGFTGDTLGQVHRILNQNTTELVDSLTNERKLEDIKKELTYESGKSWSTNKYDDYY